MTTSLFTNKGSILFVLFFFMFSCSKKDKISPSEPKTEPPFTVVKGTMELSMVNVIGYQVINIKVKDLALDKPDYEVEIGSKKGKAIRNFDNSLDFMIPGDLTNGKYQVKMAIASNTIEINLTAPTKVADPEKAFKEFIGDPTVEINKLTTDLGLTNPPQYLLEAKQKIEEGLAKFNALSVADKQIAVQVLEANSKAITELSLLLDEEVDLSANRILNKGSMGMLALSPCNFRCYLKHGAKIVLAAVALTSASTVVAPAFASLVTVDFIASILTGKRAVVITAVKTKLSTAFDWTFYPQIKYVESIIEEGFSKGITNMVVKQERIVKGEVFTFKLTPVYRTLLRSDANIPTMPEAASFVEAYDRLKAAYDKELSKTMGPLPNFVEKEAKIATKLLADWEIKVVSNSNVTVTTPQGLPHNFTVKFDSKVKGDQEFDFEISLKNPGEETVKEKISAILVDVEPDKIEIYGGNNQTGEANKKMSALMVLVKDKNGKALEGVKVDWAVTSGGGSLTAYPLITAHQSASNEHGIAEVDWTLGVSGEQSVQAVVKKRDGSYVKGSPLMFNATISHPTKIEVFSGDNQSGEVGKKLPQLLKVKVWDERGVPLKGARVKWVALHGGGKMNLSETFTDGSGIAEAELTVGPELYQLVQATTVKKDGTVIQANFAVTLFNLLGKWNIEYESYHIYNSAGTLLNNYEDNEFEYLEFGNNGKLTAVYDGDSIFGAYTLDLANNFLYLSTPEPDEDERLNSKFKVSKPLAASFTLTSDKISKRGSYIPNGSSTAISYPPGSYEIVELKLRKQ